MDRRTFVLSVAAGSALTWRPAEALPTWVRLGSRTVRLTSRSDTIVVKQSGPITALEFRTRRSPIFITTAEVSFDRGASEHLTVNEFIRAHWHSRRLELRNRDREIKRVAFGFRPTEQAQTTSAFVELFGRR